MRDLSRTSFAGYTLGTWYPTGYIVALTHEQTDAERVQLELQQAGVEHVQVWTAQEVLANYAAFQKQRSVIERVVASVAAEERTVRDDNVEAAQEGYSFLTIPVSDRARFDDIRQILGTHPIRRAHYYGRYTITDLALYAAR